MSGTSPTEEWDPVRTDTGDGRRGRAGNKWVTMVLFVLGEHPEPMRHSQVQRAIPGASKKRLTQTLRNLEGDGLVTRTVAATVPVTVTYALTDLGHSLLAALRPLKEWTDEHYPENEAARSAR